MSQSKTWSRLTPALTTSLVCSYDLVGGAERLLLQLLDPIRDRLDLDATVLASPGALTGALTARGIAVKPPLPVGTSAASIPAGALRLARRWRTQPPEVALALGTKAALVAVAAGALAGVRVVWLTNDHSFSGPVRTALGAAVDAVCSDSAEVARSTGREDAFVFGPTRPIPALPRDEARRILADRGVPDDGLWLACVGRLNDYKGFDDAIRAIARRPGWRVVIVGDEDPHQPGQAAALDRLAAEVGGGDRVHRVGAFPDAAVVMGAFDALAVLTKPAGGRIAGEGFSLVALEAMAASVPVVLAGTPGIAPLALTDDPAGIGIRGGAPAELADALDRLSDPALRNRLGGRGRAIATSLPRVDEPACDLLRLLTTTARRPGAAAVDGPAISVVTTVLNEAGNTDRLLSQLRPQLRDGDELIVVDGGSRDQTAEVVRTHGRADDRVRLVTETGAGISAGRNAGIRAATNDWIACTDAGCEPVPGWLAAMRAACTTNAGLVTGVYRVIARNRCEQAMAAVAYPDIAEAAHPNLAVRAYTKLFGRGFDATRPTGRSMAFRRTDALSMGGFPEDLQTGEDVLFGQRLLEHNHGTAVLATDAEVSWLQRDTLASNARMFYRYGLGSGASRNPIMLGRDLARAFAFVAALVAIITGRGRRAAIAGIAGYCSLPTVRALRSPRPASAPLVPVVTVVRDAAKVWGALAGLAGRRA